MKKEQFMGNINEERIKAKKALDIANLTVGGLLINYVLLYLGLFLIVCKSQ